VQYLHEVVLSDVGPIENLKIKAEFQINGNPKPIVLVGTNGAGKTIVLSTIIDALTEFACAAGFSDIAEPLDGGGHKYFRVSGGLLTRLGSSSHFSSVRMAQSTTDVKTSQWTYIDKTGAFSANEWSTVVGTDITYPGDSAENYKNVNISSNSANVQSDGQSIKSIFLKAAFCYFPVDRSESPFWASKKLIKEDITDGMNRFGRELRKPLVCTEAEFQNATWLMDVILDDLVQGHAKKLDHAKEIGKRVAAHIPITTYDLQLVINTESLIIFQNVCKILSTLLGYPARFSISARQNNKRLHFCRSDKDDSDSLHISHLSHGQSNLLSIFCTIMRYADQANPQSLADIEGVVIIDEADAGLHIEYQRTVLPALMHLMPKVQFVITTHSPLLLLGLESAYGVDGIQIIEIPTGRKISGEEFSEFGDAFAAIESTKKFKTSFDELIRQKSSKPILLVEGQSDEILIRAAWKKLRKGSDFPFAVSGKLDRTHLRLVLSDIGKTGIDTSLPVLALWDFDDAFSDWETLIKRRGGKAQYAEIECRSEHSGLVFKASNGTQVFGALLPVPQFRAEQASRNFGKSSVLSTELLFTDSDLTTLGAIEESSAVGGGKIVKIKSKDKISLANSLALLDGDAFENFEPLLKLLEELLLPQLSAANDADEKLI
jgi:AAA domain, putative AbiEii toxin, Type IV TA system